MKSITEPNPFKALIIKNFRSGRPSGDMMVKSFSDNICLAKPNAQIDVFGAADGEAIPDPLEYDFIVLSGGTVNLLEDEKPAWTVSVLDLIRKVAQQDKTKLLGICWGHQATHYALGGQLAVLDYGPLIGVQQIQLNEDGQKFFGTESLALHKYHKRVVSTPTPDFIALADNNEIFITKSRKIMSFQGHPELSYQIAKAMMETDDGSYQPPANVPKSDTALKIQDISASQDGKKVWVNIMKWATS
ncbi:class I glutamine amidotransferase-like protein [Pseudomassariella vexata]|uniref:Class I glutamine amidotransferase-like protein n=1 Tax=Pseudomassariella vexata TaxID=1141098 RepID=A0A1Y2DQU6_9PEZI|nr:class I glutamine amidotransferase-like protein [Pseudomassariella vexata]ORY61663.1 class I glutamine amidotransferase-like protein [Pseudomassariella vexata]